MKDRTIKIYGIKDLNIFKKKSRQNQMREKLSLMSKEDLTFTPFLTRMEVQNETGIP